LADTPRALRQHVTGRIIERAGDPIRRTRGEFFMTRITLAGRAGALLIPVALLLAACDGATGSAAATASGGTSGTTAAPSAGTVPSQATGESPDASSPFAIPSFDISAITKGLANVDSYRISITVNGVEQYKGVVVTKPVLSRDLTVSGGTRIVVIGDEAWVGQGSEPLKSVPSQMATAMFAAFDPTLLVGAFSGPEWAQSSLDKGVEEKNGVQAHHFLIDSTTAVGGFSGVAAGAAINIWIAEDGYLVAWESTGVGNSDISIQVTGVDDPTNKVDRPA
jgi:hypothetical protein